MGPTNEFEIEARRCGYRRIAGLDEAGRGPLAGPVVAAAVILPARCRLTGVDDSKQLTKADRERLYALIRARAVCIGVGSATEQEIDRINILEATRLAMRRAVAALSPAADCLLIDAVTLRCPGVLSRSIIMGDALCFSVAAASIVAKVTRDRLMVEYHRLYPQYNFLSHKGYGTDEHLKRLDEHGPCAIHRRTFAPVAQIICRSLRPYPTSVSPSKETPRSIA
ncbi:ribonuclease HII [Nitrospira sp. KM1]|uniref:ribonuclease HII n=1 Tax=Nitrospira sp. KM1 TaxID=1936990 RepID=UPI0013A78DCC|nr:ribonuclease HII [Nitrospira sp. KM1]BCA54288.1 ribonuclease HII [Nitrospira sp. KM1]